MTNLPSYILAVTCSLLHHHYSFLWWWHKGKKASPPHHLASYYPIKHIPPLKKVWTKTLHTIVVPFLASKYWTFLHIVKENCCNWPLNENINLQAFTETLTVLYLKKCIRKSIWKSFLHMHILQNNLSFKVVLLIWIKIIRIRIRHQYWEKPWITNLKI